MKTNLLIPFFLLLCLHLTGQNEIVYLDTPHAEEAKAAKIEMADLDGNGIPEIIVCDINGISIYNIDDYESYAWHRWDVGSALDFDYSNLSIQDIDNDGNIDIVLMGVNVIHMYFNQGNLIFDQKHLFTELAKPLARELSFPDMDKDGDTDIVAGVDKDIYWIENVESWSDYVIHQIPYNGPNVRGVTAIDWDQDGDTDIMTQPGAVAHPIGVLLSEDGTWLNHTLAETNGGIFNVHTADIDGDLIPEVGVATLKGPLIINTISDEVQNIPQDLQDYNFPKGGQFLNYYGHQIWIQCNWPEGQLVYNPISNDGIIADFVNTEIFIPNAHDFKLYDGDNNGFLDLFFSCYHGENLIGVIPDIDLGLIDINSVASEVQEAAIKMYHFERTLYFSSSEKINLERITIHDMSGRLMSSSQIRSTQNSYRIPDRLAPGNYVATLNGAKNNSSLKFVITN